MKHTQYILREKDTEISNLQELEEEDNKELMHMKDLCQRKEAALKDLKEHVER